MMHDRKDVSFAIMVVAPSLLWGIVVLYLLGGFVRTLPVPESLQETSVTVRCEIPQPYGAPRVVQGSGSIVQRVIDGDVHTFVWTAAHVVQVFRHEKRIADSHGKVRVEVEFDDPEIVVQTRDGFGQLISRKLMKCKVIRYSDADKGHDLALLRVREVNAFPLSADTRFMPANYVPSIGTELCHCGSMLGESAGANSHTTGVMSKPGRGIFDQVTVVSYPGSSGGGIHLRSDGRYVGMLVRGVIKKQGMNFIVPVRRMHTWAAKVGVEWALDASFGVPSLQEIEAAPVESGIVLKDVTADLPEGTALLVHPGRKPVLLHFWSPHCGPCRQMERNVFSDPAVKKYIEENYVLAKINTSTDRGKARRYGIHGIPADVIVAPDGRELGRRVGACSAAQYIRFLRRYTTR